MNKTILLLSLSVVNYCISTAYADTFGTGTNVFEIEFVTIGNPDNAADTTGFPNPAGAVTYEYRIGKYEISEDMIDKANAESALDGISLSITKSTRGPNKPVTSVSWFEAAKFVNWLNTSTGSSPAYKFDVSGNFRLWESSDAGYSPENLYRSSLATYFLPGVDEWYKAAYYDPISGVYYDFPTGSNNPSPLVELEDITNAGVLSPYGTMAQGGNVWEWEETEFNPVVEPGISDRGFRGGASGNPAHFASATWRLSLAPSSESSNIGFRIASIIPEPTTCGLALSATFLFAISRRRDSP